MANILLVAWGRCDGAKNSYWPRISQGCCRRASLYQFHPGWHCFEDCTDSWGTARRVKVDNNLSTHLLSGLTYVLDHFQCSDVRQLSGYQLPQGSLLTPQSLTETPSFFQDVSPIILKTIQSCKVNIEFSLLMSRPGAGITFFNKILGRVRKDGQMMELWNSEAGIVIQLDHQTFHLLVLHGDSWVH